MNTKNNEKLTMTVTFRVTQPQAVALRAMFEYWNALANVGSSKEVAFYVDGDGNFKPHCQIMIDKPEIRTDDKEWKKKAVIKDQDGNRIYDFDSIAWAIDKEEEDFKKRVKEDRKNNCKSEENDTDTPNMQGG